MPPCLPLAGSMSVAIVVLECEVISALAAHYVVVVVVATVVAAVVVIVDPKQVLQAKEPCPRLVLPWCLPSPPPTVAT